MTLKASPNRPSGRGPSVAPSARSSAEGRPPGSSPGGPSAGVGLRHAATLRAKVSVMSTTWSRAGWAWARSRRRARAASSRCNRPGEGVLGRGVVAGAHRRLTGRQVVEMARLEAVVVALRALADHPLRPHRESPARSRAAARRSVPPSRRGNPPANARRSRRMPRTWAPAPQGWDRRDVGVRPGALLAVGDAGRVTSMPTRSPGRHRPGRPKSASSGWAATTRMRSISVSGRGWATPPQPRHRVRPPGVSPAGGGPARHTPKSER